MNESCGIIYHAFWIIMALNVFFFFGNLFFYIKQKEKK